MAGKKKRDFNNPEQENIAFGQAVRFFRGQKKKSQLGLSFDSGLDRTYISLIELGQRSPTLSTIVHICRGLEISLVDLAAKTEEFMEASLHNE